MSRLWRMADSNVADDTWTGISESVLLGALAQAGVMGAKVEKEQVSTCQLVDAPTIRTNTSFPSTYPMSCNNPPS